LRFTWQGMKGKYLFYGLLFCLMVLATSSFKPVDDSFKITIRYTYNFEFENLNIITISGDSKKAIVSYFKADTVNRIAMHSDSHFPKEYNNNSWANLSDIEKDSIRIITDSIGMKYRRQTNKETRINVENNPLFFRQIDSILHLPDSVLLSVPKLPPHTTRVVLDGIYYRINAEYGDKKRELSVHSPDNKYYGPIYRFITASEIFIRSNKN